MVKNLFILGFAAIALASCGGQSDKLQSQVDSLRAELQTSQQFSQTLQEVGTLMDSIDANRQLLRVNMVEGTTYDNYTSRMKDINNYVKDTQNKIEDLEKSLKKSKGNANAYAATIKKLKADLEAKNKEISALQEMVASLGNENKNLITTIDLQEAELNDKSAQIESKKQELALLEEKIQQVQLQSKISEADSYYARAQAIEEAGNRTKLAPKKKKETYKEAIELYKKSLSLGKTEAQANIDALEKKIK
jgi:chromosome segregation ATPase